MSEQTINRDVNLSKEIKQQIVEEVGNFFGT